MGKKTAAIDKTFIKKRDALVERTAAVMGLSADEASQRLCIPLVHSLRINTLLGEEAEIIQELKELGWKGEAVSWCPQGYTIEQGFDEIKNCGLVAEGKIYLQNQSSWLPVLALNVEPGEEVLDLCAAPGGKTSHMAAIMRNKGRIVAYDTSRPRYLKLQNNLSRLGVGISECKLTDSSHSNALSAGFFDKILLDAPCSGEGLVNLEMSNSLDTWSVAHIRRLAALQKQMILKAWTMLKPGGTLVYSTCTMAPEENEAVIEYLLRKAAGVHVQELDLPVSSGILGWNGRDFPPETKKAGRVYPATGSEGFFVCKIKKQARSSQGSVVS